MTNDISIPRPSLEVEMPTSKVLPDQNRQKTKLIKRTIIESGCHYAFNQVC